MAGDRDYNLAIETSAQAGSICLGRGDKILGSVSFAHATRRPSKGAELMPSIQSICRDQGVEPRQLGQVYVSVGPGSFTGLRIGVTTAKMLAQVTGLAIVAVPTLAVVAQNGPADADTVAVCLNLKRQTVYAGVFQRDHHPDGHPDGHEINPGANGLWNPITEPALMTMQQLLDQVPRPVTILGQTLPGLATDAEHDAQITVLEGAAALPRAESVYVLGRVASRRNEFVDPYDLVPLYIRRPEALEIWEKRHGSTADPR